VDSEFRTVDLDGESPIGDVLLALANEPGLVCLWGDGWGSMIIGSRPIEVSSDRSALDRRRPGQTWFGWLGYDRTDHFALHDHVLRRVAGRWQFEMAWTRERAAELLDAERRFRAAVASAPLERSWQVGPFTGGRRDDHLRSVEEAIGLIRAGELYQVNVCTRLQSEFTGNSVALFAEAVERLQPAYAAYVRDTSSAVVSLSPELFVRREGRDVMSAPIKGTRARDHTDRGAVELRGSAKDAAENVMIVDLVRNDLGRVSVPGSVQARGLLEIQPHPGLWHLVSAVGGTLRAGVSDHELIQAMFPPGSVTGAPKLRAMAAIEELESTPRGLYTGAVGVVSDQGLTFNVAIRTFEVAGGRIELGVGGGITVDSVPVLEWAETRQKAAPLIEAVRGSMVRGDDVGTPTAAQLDGGLLETMLSVDGGILRLADHLSRIDLSCRELYGSRLPPTADRAVREAARERSGRRAVRLVVRPDLGFDVTVGPGLPVPGGLVLHTARRPGVWRHKWADRSWATEADALFIAEDGTVLETTRGNVFMIGAGGELITAPLRDDLLPGVTRRAVLDLARDEGCRVELRGFTLSELSGARALFTTSSLSGIVVVKSVDGSSVAAATDVVEMFAARLKFPVGLANIVS
jgi:para-aminobenzoate synthetase/4-amino-4-deoxychorismate lyase